MPADQYENVNLIVKVMDDDGGFDDQIGSVIIDISHLFKKPGDWIN